MKTLLLVAAAAFTLSGTTDTHAAPFFGRGSTSGSKHATPAAPSHGSKHGATNNSSRHATPAAPSRGNKHGSPSYGGRGGASSHHSSHAAPSRGHHGPVTKVRTVEIGRRTMVRTVRGFRGYPRTVHVTEITYRDYFSNGSTRIWTRTI